MTAQGEYLLDGDPKDFPKREEAMQKYREAYVLRRRLIARGLSHDEPAILSLERQMDSLQTQISRGPGPLWREFFDSLPHGPIRWWESLLAYVFK